MAGSATIGSLRVNLGLDSAQFQQGMKQAQSTMKRVGDVMKRVGAAMAAALSAAIAGVTVALRRSISEMDKLAKTARKIGMPTEELSRFRHAAELSGIAANTLDMALQRFTRRAAEAANGSGEAKDALAEMGIQLTDAQGRMLSTSHLLDQVANAFREVEDPAERVRLAFKLFDSEGVSMINMLSQGSDELARMKAEADALGIVVDTKTAVAAERFNDDLTRLGAIIRGLIMKVTAQLLPTLERLSQTFVDVANDSTLLQDMANGLSRVFKGVSFVAIEVATAVRQVSAEITGLAKAAKALSRGDFAGAWDAFLEGQRRSQEAFADYERALKRLSAKVPSALPITGEVEAGTGARADKVSSGANRPPFTLPTIDVPSVPRVGGGSAAASIEDTAEATREATEAWKGLTFEMPRVRAGLSETTGELGRTVSAGLDPLKRALVDGQTSFKSFADAMAEIGRDLAARLIDQAFKPIENAIAGLFKNLGGSGGILGGLLGGGAAGNTFGIAGFGGAIPGLADGGVARGWSIVGENGPELMKAPASGARVFSNEDSRAMMGGGDVVIHNNPTFNGIATTQDLQRRLDKNNQKLVEAIVDRRHRDPHFLA